jgi:Uma2 family endonuclease
MVPMMNDDREPQTEPAASTSDSDGDVPVWEVPPEVLPNLDELVIEDDQPVDNQYVEKQQRLLTEPLYSSWAGTEDGRPFRALSNVGLFYARGRRPLVPDAMLSLRTPPLGDMRLRENRSYFVWIVGKVPEVVIEIVSDRSGGEATYKLREYAAMGVLYYIIYDPQEYLGQGVLRAFALREGSYEPIDCSWLPAVGLGLILWRGAYEGVEETWLRWCDQDGQVIATGRERSEQERQQAEEARRQAEEAQRQAEEAQRQTEEAHRQAEQERQRAERLAAQLRALGIDPSA